MGHHLLNPDLVPIRYYISQRVFLAAEVRILAAWHRGSWNGLQGSRLSKAFKGLHGGSWLLIAIGKHRYICIIATALDPAYATEAIC